MMPGDILRGDDPEPPVGTVIQLCDGELWERVALLGIHRWAAHHDPTRRPTWTWGRATFEGPVIVMRTP